MNLLITHIFVSFIALLSALLWMHYSVWWLKHEDTKENRPLLLLAMIIPVIVLAVCGVTAWGVSTVKLSEFQLLLAIAVITLLAITAIVIASIFSIKKYRAEGLKPHYTAFALIFCYSLLTLTITLCLIL